ncbi:Ribosomal large subunit pseudouridine synthase C [Gemmata obscuriglobus]|uniref:RluA family pseudouridine synthase n=1 Tax=Gemmata obscuriglobus TaxID=114 RepID=UPI00016C4D9D|nr:RluA family pseudouridine synthase [Gemmata obscuriglobus]QEG28500.1 Ribosomal large subunit pseudouridine synthase C [Gemmata obscuriglobus]VTS06540.1 ribosomal large subunit pseudouridine synthase d : Pseudouridine synthase OS=Pirellula staleyi (strain ATCC 27377 / DSM 6068 / ICPB 4128) GN=Psta_0906 PE=3 SV=1: S4: PseudoU_synth_2 [Gemmata obscuriglobus UQM 2246]
MPPIQFVVDRRDAGQTLAAVLKSRFGLSWAQAKRLVEKRHVKVSGQVETDVARRLKLGKRVELAAGTVEIKQALPSKKTGAAKKAEPGKKATERPRPPAPRPKPALELGLSPDAIVYVDDAVVVVNKPAGLTTMRHKEEAEEFGAHGQRFLTKTLAGLLPTLLGTPDRAVTAVHRLDRDTSGLVVFARTRAAGENLTAQFRKHSTERRYLALTRGVPKPGRIASVFVSDRGDGRRGTTTDLAADGKRAVTHVAVLEPLGPFALVECRLETGRTHQVRIHLGEAGAPLCGEGVYDRPIDGQPLPDGSGAQRPMLHATRLGFAHPDTGAAVSWEVPPPEDFRRLLAKLRVASEPEE